MARVSTSTAQSDLTQDTWTSRLVHWVVDTRAHRILCLLIGIWIFNAFDLMFTILSHQQGMLHEENPLARHMLQHGILAIVLYKVGLVLIGSYPLLRFRRARITELGAIVILVTYAILAVHWTQCYEQYSISASTTVNFSDGVTSTQ